MEWILPSEPAEETNAESLISDFYPPEPPEDEICLIKLPPSLIKLLQQR